MKKKHTANIKDLTKQLQKINKTEVTKSLSSNNSSNALTSSTSSTLRISRTNSLCSLDQEEMKSVNGSISSSESTQAGNQLSTLNSTSNSLTVTNNYHNTTFNIDSSVNQYNTADVYVMDPDRQKIIEKVVKLQKQLARRNEKIEFLQDHIQQLTIDTKRKTK